MILFAISAFAASICSSSTPDEIALELINAMKTSNYSCLKRVLNNPDLKFPSGEIDPAVLDSLNFHQKGKRSYIDIAREGVNVDVFGNKKEKSIFFVDKKKWNLYLLNKSSFKKKYFMKYYFVCNAQKVGRSWKFTEDLCFTEGES